MADTKNILGKRYFATGRAFIKLNKVQREARSAVEKLIKDGAYRFESVPCLCGASVEHDLVLAIVDRYGLEHRTVICQICGLIRANPRLDQASYYNFYESLYRQLYSGQQNFSQSQFRERSERYSARGRRIVEFLKRSKIDVAGKTVLEMGAGGGWNLSAFEQFGAKAIGFDYGKYVEFGKKLYGLDLRCGGIKEAIDQGIEADVIILSHVVEHFTDPVGELKRLKNLFVPNGVCYIETPGVLNIHNSHISLMGMLQNAHTYSFSKTTLQHLMRKCGYEVQYGDEFIRMLCRPSHSTSAVPEIDPNHSRLVVEYLKDCEKKRPFRTFARRLRSVPKRAIILSLKGSGSYEFARKMYRKFVK
jgi:2-polyprenyl-3-methyl-5-hydroxy-6-metoxy-1,4-benzoquinol methylase